MSVHSEEGPMVWLLPQLYNSWTTFILLYIEPLIEMIPKPKTLNRLLQVGGSHQPRVLGGSLISSPSESLKDRRSY